MSMITRHCLCGCLSDAPLERLTEFFNHPEVDLIEWRLDNFIRRHSLPKTLETLPVLNSSPRRPVLATNRPKREGGNFEGPEKVRIEVLQQAVEAGVEWVDLEADIAGEALEWFESKDVRVLLSHHDFSETPDRSTLQRLAAKMAERETDAIKIATYAHAPEDNLRVLELISFGRHQLGMDVIAFCMGPLGRWSRITALLLGSPWAYVQLPGQCAAAPGQFTAEKMRTALELLS